MIQVKEPILVVGIGGAGSKLALQAKNLLDSDCMMISNDSKDFVENNPSIHVLTDSVINPSTQLIRGCTYNFEEQIREKIEGYSTVILMSNLAGKAGAAMAPIVSGLCKELDKGLISFAVMPFKYEKDRIFDSGISLKRLKENSECTIILDNDSLLENNPELDQKTCYGIANSAMMHIIKSLNTLEISKDTNIITTSKDGQNIEESLRDSLKMLYGNTLPSSVKHSILHIVGGDNIPTGILNSLSELTGGVLNKTNSQANTESVSNESKIIMLSTVQGTTKFDKYDPLGVISQENTLDWDTPDSSINCQLDLYQLE